MSEGISPIENEETTKEILVSVSQNLGEIAESLGAISYNLEALVELLTECTFTFDRGKARALRNAPVVD